MKKTKTFISIVFAFALFSVFSLTAVSQEKKKTVEDVIAEFDKTVSERYANINLGISSFTYMETDGSGTISAWLQQELKTLISSKTHLKLSAAANFEKQPSASAGSASRAPASGNHTIGKENYYILSGKCYEYGDYIEVILSIDGVSGKNLVSQKAYIPAAEIKARKLTLAPPNIKTVEAVAEEFDEAAKEKPKRKNGSIALRADLLNQYDEITKEFLRGDKVKFRIEIQNEKNAFIAIQCVDVENNKSWIPVEANFIEGGTSRIFESYYDEEYVVMQDSLLGAESILIYAAENESDLPKQDGEVSAYKKGDISRAVTTAKKNCDVFKIAYTIVEE